MATKIETTVHGVGTLQDGKATSWQIWATEYDDNGTALGQIQMTPDQAAALCQEVQARLSAIQGGAGSSPIEAALNVVDTVYSTAANAPAGQGLAATTSLLQTAAGGIASEVATEATEGLGSAAIEALLGGIG